VISPTQEDEGELWILQYLDRLIEVIFVGEMEGSELEPFIEMC
jgi:hypothetical protein